MAEVSNSTNPAPTEKKKKDRSGQRWHRNRQGKSKPSEEAKDTEVNDLAKKIEHVPLDEPPTPPRPETEWKWAIRKRIWDLMEREDYAEFPRPVHHRIPNFIGAEKAAEAAIILKEMHQAETIKINPDTPQKPVRIMCLKRKQKIIVPQPRLRTGFFSELDGANISEEKIKFCSTQAGVAEVGRPLDIHAKLKIDCVVIGSVAVNPANGARIGKGEGFADLEYGMSRLMGAIDDSTPVITTCHDCQLVDDIPVEKMMASDVPVDIIVTPTRVIRVPKKAMPPKPKGIYWELLSPEKLGQIKVLRELRKFIEDRDGVTLPIGPSQPLPPTAQRNGKGKGKGGRKGKGKGYRGK